MRVCTFDIGGSAVKSAVIDISENEDTLLENLHTTELQEATFDEVRKAVLATLQETLKEYGPSLRIAICTAGAVNKDGTVLRAGNIHGYENISWTDVVKNAHPNINSVTVVNDGRASCWAEYKAHSLGLEDPFAHFVVGTGIGGGVIVEGVPLIGAHSAAGGLGHIKVSHGETVQCSCKKFGCVETLAAAPAITRGFNATSEAPVTFQDVLAAANEADDLALSNLEQAGEWLGVAISNVINIVNPAVVTIGGGVIQATENIRGSDGNHLSYLNAARKVAKNLALERISSSTKILAAKHGNNGGLIGAALLASR